MKVKASIVEGVKEPWHTEEIEVDEPHAHEVRVKMVYAGMCQSDEHLRHGDFSAPPELLAMLTKNGTMFPAIGGHEGRGHHGRGRRGGAGLRARRLRRRVVHPLVRQVPMVRRRAAATSATSGWTILAGPMIADGTYRHHLGDEDLNRMCQLGTFSE